LKNNRVLFILKMSGSRGSPCTSTNVNIGISISKTAPETYFAEGLMMTC